MHQKNVPETALFNNSSTPKPTSIWGITGIVFVFLLLAACKSPGVKLIIRTVHTQTDSCASHPGHHYEISIPVIEGQPSARLPLMILLDSHGDGRYALRHFSKALTRYPMIVAGSDLIRNDFQGFSRAIEELITDIRQKYPVTPTIWIAGFSGGARMALDYALAHPVDGLILSGALATPAQLGQLQCPVIAISGTNDFNFPETAQYLLMSHKPGNLKIILTHASHDWPAPSVLTEGTALLAFENSPLKYSTAQFDDFESAEKRQIDSLITGGEYLKAALTASNLTPSASYKPSGEFLQRYQQLVNSAKFHQQQTKLLQTLRTGQQAKQRYYQALLKKDTLWWKNESGQLSRNEKDAVDPLEKSLYQRIRGFWGIACFSISRQAVQTHNARLLEQITPVYRLLEPDNPDAYFYSAYLPYWANDSQQTVKLLKTAQRKGFTDLRRLKHFPPSILQQLDN